MPRITVPISRQDIFHICEGISASIAQHNGGTPSYEQLWASGDEAPKLDIYYREAVGDLERNLIRWVREASAQFDLQADGTDYILELEASRYWPQKLEGLLCNKIQDYLVHAVTAGWLNDFQGLEIKQDYRALGAQDISDIHNIICQRSFKFTESLRAEDDSTKSAALHDTAMRHQDNTLTGCRREKTALRRSDNSKNTPENEYTPGQRRADDSKNTPENEYTPGQRRADDSKNTPENEYTPGQRRADDEKNMPGLRREAGLRRADDDNKHEGKKRHEARLRHQDNTLELRNREKTTGRRSDDSKERQQHTIDTRHRLGDGIKKGKPYSIEAQDRHDDDSRKVLSTPKVCTEGMRHQDNAIVEHHSEYTDWSGSSGRSGQRHYNPHTMHPINTGAVVKRESCRVSHGMGHTPDMQRPPLPPEKEKEQKVTMTSGGQIGALQLNKDLLRSENVGKIYNVTEGFFPTNDFLEGASDKRLNPGTNVTVVDVGTPENPKYMFDLFESPKEENVFVDIDHTVVDDWF